MATFSWMVLLVGLFETRLSRFLGGVGTGCLRLGLPASSGPSSEGSEFPRGMSAQPSPFPGPEEPGSSGSHAASEGSLAPQVPPTEVTPLEWPRAAAGGGAASSGGLRVRAGRIVRRRSPVLLGVDPLVEVFGPGARAPPRPPPAKRPPERPGRGPAARRLRSASRKPRTRLLRTGGQTGLGGLARA